MADYTMIQGESFSLTATASWAATLSASQTATLVVATAKGVTPAISKAMTKNDANTKFVGVIESTESAALELRTYDVEITITDTSTTPTTVAKEQKTLQVTQKVS